MGRQCSNNLNRAIEVAKYIIEGTGHTTLEASEEFGIGKTTIQRDINQLGVVAFYSEYRSDSKELKILYCKVQKTLKKLAKQHYTDSIKKRNNSKTATSD